MNSDSSNVTSLLVTRHPFTRSHSKSKNVLQICFLTWDGWNKFLSPCFRLVSAFRDKIERCHEVKPNSSVCDGKKDWYYKKYGQEMIRRYRSKYKQKFGEDSLLEKYEHHDLSPLSLVIQEQLRVSLPDLPECGLADILGVRAVRQQSRQADHPGPPLEAGLCLLHSLQFLLQIFAQVWKH